MAFDSAVSLLFKINADGSNADKELKKFANTLGTEIAGSSKTAQSALARVTASLFETETATNKAAEAAIKAAAKVAAADKLAADAAKLRAVEAKAAGADNAQVLEREAQAIALNSQKSALALSVLKQESKAASEALEEGAAGAASGFTALLNPITIGIAAVAALGIGAVVTGKALFNLAEESASFGAKLYDASLKTGLSAASISALSFAADQSNVSLESVVTSVNIFEKTLAKAAEGSKSASAILTRAGLDPATAYKSLESSLESVFNKLSKLPDNSIAKLGLLKELFGRNGDSVAQLLDTIKRGGGTFEDFKKKLEETGLILSDKDLKASKDFEKALSELEYQGKILAFNFAGQYIPQITAAIQSVGKFFASNKPAIEAFGTAVAGVILELRALIGFVADHPIITRIIAGVATAGASEGVVGVVNAAHSVGAANPIPGNNVLPAPNAPVPEIENEKAAADREKAAEQAKKDREQAYKDYVTDQSRFNDAKQKVQQENYERAQRENEQRLKEGASEKDYQQVSIVNLNTFVARSRELLDEKFRLESKGVKGTKYDTLVLEYNSAVAKLEDLRTSTTEKVQKDVTETEKKNSTERLKITETELNNKLEVLRANGDKQLAIIAQNNADQKQLESHRINDEQKIRTDALRDELELNKQLLNNSDLSPEKRAEINQKIAVLDVELATQKINASVLVKEAIDKETAAQDEAARKARENLERIKLQILKTENDLKAVQSQQKRDAIADSLNSGTLTAQGRLSALIQLRDFDLAENARQKADAISEATQEHDLQIAKIKDKDKEAEQVQAINDLLQKRIDLINGESSANAAKINRQADKPIEQSTVDASGGGFLGGVLSGAGIGAESLTKKLEPLKTIGNIIGGQFNAIAGAVGNAVEAFVLYGNAGTSVRKVTAQILASIAQQSAVQALYEFAQGLAITALAFFGVPNAGPSAAAHFAAAAEFGLIAGVAAVAGRGAAGNSFASNTATGGGGSNSNANGGTGSGTNAQKQGSGEAGGYYSSESETRTFEEDRLRSQQPNKQVIELHVKSNDSHIVNVINNDIDTLGKTHGTIVKVVTVT